MEKKLAVIVDNNEEITTGAGNTEMCSCGTDVVMEMCSPESHDTLRVHSVDDKSLVGRG